MILSPLAIDKNNIPKYVPLWRGQGEGNHNYKTFRKLALNSITMKKLYTLLFAIAFTGLSYAQGTIQSFTIDPPSPTTADFVKVYVSVQFGSSGCAVDNQGHSTTGSSTSAYAHHCLGMLSAICNNIDTFNLGMLPAGSHVFSMTLTSGFGGAGCTAGIIPDDNRNTTFTVSNSVGINDPNTLNPISVSPNPSNGNFIIICPNQNSKLNIYNILGEIIYTQELKSNKSEINISNQNKGIYFYQMMNAEKVVGNGKLVVE